MRVNFREKYPFTMALILIVLTIRAIYAQECYDDGNEFCIDQDDILSVDLLPGSFLFADQRPAEGAAKLPTNESTDGSFNNALSEMKFHRKKMNEYLCHGYMAEEIVKVARTPRVKRRPDSPAINDLRDFLGDDNVTIHDKLLSDEGSSKYKNWLQRTTTLDDVYRHYSPHKKLRRKQGVQEEGLEEFDGEVTGYAMPAPVPVPSGKIGFYEGPSGDDHMISSSSGHNFHYGHSFGHGGHHFPPHPEIYPAIHEEHYYHPAPYHEPEEEHHRPYYHKSKGHELSIRDFFEIALTALAFLAFGLFIIQLLMNATNSGNATAATMVTDDGQRFKRNVGGLPLSYASNEELNQLSYTVLRSIEAALIADIDSGNCLRRILCEDNQRSMRSGDARKIWIPVWSLGMSWISSRVLKRSPWSAMLDSVKASILGLGGAECASLYPNCDLRKERIKRRRRRRK